jgi:hypothetical protein
MSLKQVKYLKSPEELWFILKYGSRFVYHGRTYEIDF